MAKTMPEWINNQLQLIYIKIYIKNFAYQSDYEDKSVFPFSEEKSFSSLLLHTDWPRIYIT